MYIAGRNCPNFRVLSDFRKDRGEFFRAGFKQTVQLALALGAGVIGTREPGRLQVQGEQLEAQAMSYGRLKEKEQNCARRSKP